MFGRRAKQRHHEDRDVDVDFVLEGDISAVVNAVDGYLQGPNERLRRELRAALEKLDDQLARGDAYHARLKMFTPGSQVVGATSSSSVAEEIPTTEFWAQVGLVKAAKNAVTRLTPDTLANLRAASEALATWRT